MRNITAPDNQTIIWIANHTAHYGPMIALGTRLANLDIETSTDKFMICPPWSSLMCLYHVMSLVLASAVQPTLLSACRYTEVADVFAATLPPMRMTVKLPACPRTASPCGLRLTYEDVFQLSQVYEQSTIDRNYCKVPMQALYLFGESIFRLNKNPPLRVLPFENAPRITMHKYMLKTFSLLRRAWDNRCSPVQWEYQSPFDRTRDHRDYDWIL